MAPREPTKAQLREQLGQERSQMAFIEEQLARTGLLEDGVPLREALAELELGFEDSNWIRDSMMAQREFSRDGLQRLIYRCRLAYLKDPLIRNGVNIQAHYVWGQGAEIRAKHQQVNDAVVQPFLDDRRNGQVLTGHAAHMEGERQLQVEGNLVFALFTNPSTGFVRVRKIPVEQVRRVITNPQDDAEVWFYERVWSERTIQADEIGFGSSKQEKALYPDWQHRPDERPAKIDDYDVVWDAPIYHVKVGGTAGMHFGVPEVFAALDWANAVKRDLEDYASIRHALSRFAWNVKVGGGATAVKRARDRLATTLDPAGSMPADTNPPPTTGAAFVSAPGWGLEPIKTAGSTTSPTDSKMLWLQVGAALGIPHTMLAGDAQGGNWATAKTLDRPTELKMADRQTLWADVLHDILEYAIDMAIVAPSGPLPGYSELDPYSETERIVIGKDEQAEPDPDTGELPDLDRSLVIRFPNILERDTKEHIDAIMHAVTLGNLTGYPQGTIPAWQINNFIPKKVISGLLMSALGVEDADEILDMIYPDADMGTGGPDDPLIGAGAGADDETVIEALGAVREAAVAITAQLREAAGG